MPATNRTKAYLAGTTFNKEKMTNLGVAGQVDPVGMADLLASIPFQDANGVILGDNTAPVTQRLCRVSVPLTAAAQTTLYTVPTGYTLVVDDVVIEGQTTISGGTSSKLLIGTTANSYNELLKGTTGHTFTSGTATTLLAVGARIRGETLAAPANASTANAKRVAAASVIKADVSGTVVTAGAVYVEIWGHLVAS